jgi:hypothetical protein
VASQIGKGRCTREGSRVPHLLPTRCPTSVRTAPPSPHLPEFARRPDRRGTAMPWLDKRTRRDAPPPRILIPQRDPHRRAEDKSGGVAGAHARVKPMDVVLGRSTGRQVDQIRRRWARGYAQSGLASVGILLFATFYLGLLLFASAAAASCGPARRSLLRMGLRAGRCSSAAAPSPPRHPHSMHSSTTRPPSRRQPESNVLGE